MEEWYSESFAVSYNDIYDIINVSGTYTINMSGTATINVSGTYTINVSGTATINVSGTYTINVSGTATINVSGGHAGGRAPRNLERRPFVNKQFSVSFPIAR